MSETPPEDPPMEPPAVGDTLPEPPREPLLPDGGDMAAGPVRVDRHLLEFLVCPVTRGPLVYDARRQELVSVGAHLAFPIRDGIPVMLIDEARRIED